MLIYKVFVVCSVAYLIAWAAIQAAKTAALVPDVDAEIAAKLWYHFPSLTPKNKELPMAGSSLRSFSFQWSRSRFGETPIPFGQIGKHAFFGLFFPSVDQMIPAIF